LKDIKIPKLGRPKVLHKSNIHYITRLITSGTFDTAVQVQKYLSGTSDISVSTSTIKRILNEVGLRSGMKIKKPLLTPYHRKLRLEWAKKHKDWTIDKWRHVIFSDETKINLFGSDGRKWCWKRPNIPLEERTIDLTMKYGGGNIIIWGCFTIDGVGFASRIYGTMDGELYKNILNDELQQTIKWYKLKKKDVILQQDKASVHTANSVRNYIKSQHIKVLDWPSQSPDLNPIENLWRDIKRRLALDQQLPKNADEMWKKFERIWEETSLELCQKLIYSMPNRVNMVIKARGGHTKY
jgi:transposase